MARHPGRAMACQTYPGRKAQCGNGLGAPISLMFTLAMLIRVAEGALKRGTPEDGLEV